MSKYKSYKDQLQRIADVEFSAGVLHWDQELCIPEETNSSCSHYAIVQMVDGEKIQSLFAAHRLATIFHSEELLRMGEDRGTLHPCSGELPQSVAHLESTDRAGLQMTVRPVQLRQR